MASEPFLQPEHLDFSATNWGDESTIPHFDIWDDNGTHDTGLGFMDVMDRNGERGIIEGAQAPTLRRPFRNKGMQKACYMPLLEFTNVIPIELGSPDRFCLLLISSYSHAITGLREMEPTATPGWVFWPMLVFLFDIVRLLKPLFVTSRLTTRKKIIGLGKTLTRYAGLDLQPPRRMGTPGP